MSDRPTTTAFHFQAGSEAMRRQVCAWLRAQAGAEAKFGRDPAHFTEAHNAMLRMDAPEVPADGE